jgi:hypothetical protein
MTTVANELVVELKLVLAQLSPEEQERVLSFAWLLAHPAQFPHMPLPPGSAPDALLRIMVDPEVGEAMAQAHEECFWPDENEAI